MIGIVIEGNLVPKSTNRMELLRNYADYVYDNDIKSSTGLDFKEGARMGGKLLKHIEDYCANTRFSTHC